MIKSILPNNAKILLILQKKKETFLWTLITNQSMSKKDEFLAKANSGQLQGRDILLLLDVMQELAETNDDVKELLNDLKEENEPITINFIVDQYRGCLSIVNGVFTAKRGLLDKALVTIHTDEPTARGILTRKIGIMNAYKGGKLKAEGSLMKLTSLAILLNILGDEIGVI
jgi:alkyl sulfatase BDS1-like metallo-beta-lactamase superfamily hydrolase